MACGQKKQNNNEGGVHLTERTCSPYNPIIKQIVDDCLGLPIYPVSSIDAVIDEDGKTLRQLLEDLLIQIKEGDLDFSQYIEEIQSKLEDLDVKFASRQELETLKTLVWAISSMANNNPEQNLYTDGVPTIVNVINKLRNDFEDFKSDDSKYGELQLLVQDLKDLLLAVANFNTDPFTADGVEHYNGNDQIKIIKEILDIKTELGLIEGSSDGTPPEGGTISQKINWLIEQVLNIIDKIETFAHLDQSLLEQNVKKLSADEYPVTSAYFIDSIDYTLGDLTADLKEKTRMFIYFPRNTVIGIYPEQSDLLYDYNKNEILDLGDVIILNNAIVSGGTVPPEGKSFDVTGDGEINISDVNELIKKILYPEQGEETIKIQAQWSKYIYEVIKDNNSPIYTVAQQYNGTINELFPGYKVIAHPLIDGKVYVNLAKNLAYRYEEHNNYGQMIKVSADTTELEESINSLANEAITQAASSDFFQPLTIIEGKGPQRLLLEYDNIICAYSNGQKDSQEQYVDEQGNNFREGRLFVVDQTYDIVALPSADESIVGKTYNELEYSIADVTSLIDYLLKSPVSMHVHDTTSDGEIINSIVQYIEDKKTEAQNQETINTCNDILTSIYNRPLFSSTNSNNNVYYIDSSTSKVVSRSETSSYYLKQAKNKQYDVDQTNSVTISQVTSLIDKLLTGKTTVTINRNVSLDPMLFVQKYQHQTRILSVGPENIDDNESAFDLDDNESVLKEAQGKIFVVVRGFDATRYIFDGQGTFKPLLPEYALGYDRGTNSINLYKDSVLESQAKLSGVPFTSNNNTSINGNNYPIVNLGEESTPFLFGLKGNIDTTCFQDASGDILVGTKFILEDTSKQYTDQSNVQRVRGPKLISDCVTTDPSTGEEIQTTSFSAEELDESYSLGSSLLNEKFNDKVADIHDAINNLNIENIEDPNTLNLINDTLSSFNTTSVYYCMDYRYDIQGKLCNIYKVKESYEVSPIQNIEEGFYATLTLEILDKISVQEGLIYYFPKFGLSLRFKQDTSYYQQSGGSERPSDREVQDKEFHWLPIVVQVETQGLGIFRTIETSDPAVQKGLLLSNTSPILPNQFNVYPIKPEINNVLFSCIPGHEVINVCGRFTSSSENSITIMNPSIRYTPSQSLRPADSNPDLIAERTYEYHILNGIFSLFDVSPEQDSSTLISS